MALLKPFETPHRVTASYHKLLKVEYDMTNQRIEMAFAIYASPEARDAGGSVLWHEYVQVPFAALAQDPRVAHYDLARKHADGYLINAAADTLVPAAEVLSINPDYVAP